VLYSEDEPEKEKVGKCKGVGFINFTTHEAALAVSGASRCS
jgi:hypothetical protein